MILESGVSMKKLSPTLLSIVLIASTLGAMSTASASVEPTVDLATAANFQILAGSALTLGASVTGTKPDSDGISSSAVEDLSAAIAAVSEFPGVTGTADLGGLTYGPGVYLSPAGAAFAMTGDVVLDAKDNSDAIFIFYTPAAMDTTASITISLINGAQAKNVYWVAGGAITTGASDILVGTFMSNAAITTGASDTITGSLLGGAAVTVGASNNFVDPIVS